jgi:hypothetical protein
MKDGIWNLLTVLVLLATLLLLIIFASIFADPQSALNPFPPPTLPARLQFPTATATLRGLPPTWTPTPENGAPVVDDPGLRPSSTLPPTSTGFVLPSFTPTATHTYTPTITYTPTNTPTNTIQPTYTLVPTYTLQPTFTDVPTQTPTEEATP